VAGRLHEALHDSPGAVDVLQVVTFLGTSVALYTLTGLVAALAMVRWRPRSALFIVVTVVSGAVLNHIVKEAVGRERPKFADPLIHSGGPSFPSGHAMNSAIVFSCAVIVLAVVLGRTGGGLFRIAVNVGVLVVVAIGFTRIALGAHYLSDVVGGWLIAAAWVGLGVAVFRPECGGGTDGRRPGRRVVPVPLGR
jgi:undecaprenyl-diphosphatase